MALKYADWEGALYDSKALAISIISCTVIFGIIAITPIDELIELLAPILELIGYGGAIAEAVHAIYDFADFFNRVKNAQSEKALQEAGDIFAHVVVTLGIEAIFALLGKLAHKSRNDLQKRKAGNSSRKEILHFNELDYKGKQELLSSMTDKELYEVVRKNSSYSWIVEDYNLITDKNIKSIVILREDGSLNLDWPKYAGLQLETIDKCKCKISIKE